MQSIRHFIVDTDLSPLEQDKILNLALQMKQHPENYRKHLSGKILGMIFTKHSTRTRVSFEAGIMQLGGGAIFLSGHDTQLGRGEPITDMGEVLSRYLNILMIRTYAHEDVVKLAHVSKIPVINGLDDLYHPCQALADLLTIREHFGTTQGKKLVYLGDGNNVAHSLLLAGVLAGMKVSVVTPEGFAPEKNIVAQAAALAENNTDIVTTHDLAATHNADVIYTDVWTSMGQEQQAETRKQALQAYQVNQSVMAQATKDAIFLHCLPAHRGEEVTTEVADGPQSRIFLQAENRLHVQKALMAFLLNQ